jgi:hypothetical protein
MHHRVGLRSGRALRIGRARAFIGLALLGATFVACSHPGGSGGVLTGSAGTTGSAGNGSPTGTAGTGNGTAGTVGTTGTAGTTGSGGDSSPTGTAGTTGSGGDVSPTGTAGNVGTPGTAGLTGTAGSGAAGTSGGGAGDGGNAGTGGSGPAGPNLIENGDFSNGATNWHTESGTGNVNGSGAYCVSSPGGTTLVGYSAPAGTMLSLSGGYKLTFQASGAGTIHIKVGMAVSPYNADYEGNSSVTSSPQTFTHMFTANDNNAGVAFTFVNAGTSTVCLDNIALGSN